MNLRYLLILIVTWACGPNCLAQSCSKNEDSFNAAIHQQADLPSGFTLRAADVPNLEEAILSIQVDLAQSKNPEVQEIKVCEFTPFTFQVQNGTVTGRSVELDSESTWLVGLGPKNDHFLLAGFPDPLNGFNALVKTLGLKVENADAARNAFDLYLRLAAGQRFRESVVVDEMQLQSLGLNDFRLRYALSKARAVYSKWWGGIGPALKSQLRKPEIVPDHDAFKIIYVRYAQGRILHESATINKNGTVTVGASKVLYAPIPLWQPQRPSH